MKQIILVFIFIGGIITGAYFLNPSIKGVEADNFQYNNEYYNEAHCGDYRDFQSRFINSDLKTEQIELIKVRFEELLIGYGITEADLYDDREITHDIMLDMVLYLESLGIDYYPNYNRGHMLR